MYGGVGCVGFIEVIGITIPSREHTVPNFLSRQQARHL
jgi:hypothetical protein